MQRMGSTSRFFGLDAQEDKDKIASLGLDTYTKMLKNADSENKDVAKRYEKYAEAQAWMIDNSLIMSAMSSGGTASVTKSNAIYKRVFTGRHQG